MPALRSLLPCRLCPHVVVVLRLVCFDDPWATHAFHVQGEIPDQAGHEGLRRGWTVEVCFQDTSAHQTWLCKQTRDGVTPEENSTSFKKDKLESATREGPREPFKRNTVDLAPVAIEGAGGVFSQ